MDKEDDKKRRNLKTVTLFPKWNTDIKFLCYSLDYARDNQSIIYVSMIYAGQLTNASMLVKNHPFTSCPAAKHQNAANVALQTYGKKQVDFVIPPHER